MVDDVALPPPLPGTRPATPRDAFRLTWWTIRSFAFGAAHGHGRSRVTSLVSLFASVIVPAGLAVLAAVDVRAPWTLIGAAVVIAIGPTVYALRIAMAQRTSWYVIDGAVIAVTAGHGTWTLSDHMSAHPGSGAGRRLRALVIPTLIAAADRDRIALTTEAADRRLAEIYLVDIPGMRKIGPAPVRGVRLRRDPQ